MKREAKAVIGNLGKLGKSAVQVSSTIIKSTKDYMKLSLENDKLDKVYIDIGKKVHEIYSYGGNLGEYFDEKYKEISDIEENIKKLKRKIEKEKDNMHFDCNNNQNTDDNQNNVNMQEIYKICSICNEKNEENSNFCIKCGRSI